MTNHKNLLQLLTEVAECVYCHAIGGCECGQVDLDDPATRLSPPTTKDHQPKEKTL